MEGSQRRKPTHSTGTEKPNLVQLGVKLETFMLWGDGTNHSPLWQTNELLISHNGSLFFQMNAWRHFLEKKKGKIIPKVHQILKRETASISNGLFFLFLINFWGKVSNLIPEWNSRIWFFLFQTVCPRWWHTVISMWESNMKVTFTSTVQLLWPYVGECSCLMCHCGILSGAEWDRAKSLLVALVILCLLSDRVLEP